MTDVSIITPFYKGNDYIHKLLNNITQVAHAVPTKRIEWIIVNDSPKTKVKLSDCINGNLTVRIFKNSQNQGIQRTRVKGLNYSSGKYIMFLDQDDILSKDALQVHLKNISHDSASITNGYVQMKNGTLLPLYRSIQQMKYVNKIKYFFYLGNLIASPGMVLLKRETIPDVWIKQQLDIEGADDWLLWVAYVSNGYTFNISFKKTYIHTKSDKNTSDNNELMLRSSQNALVIFEKYYCSFQKLCNVYKRRLSMRKNIELMSHNKLWEYLKNWDIGLTLFRYKKF